MAKTRIEYEASDIDLDGNPMHKAVEGAVIASAFIWMAKSATVKGDAEAGKNVSRIAVAAALSIIENLGFVLTPKESVPPVFDDLFKGGL